jgi:hypothetical protein
MARSAIGGNGEPGADQANAGQAATAQLDQVKGNGHRPQPGGTPEGLFHPLPTDSAADVGGGTPLVDDRSAA